jgi:hypothetical protein
MKNCDHRSWLSFHGKEEIVFRHASTLSDIVTSLNAPAEKIPSLVFLHGDRSDASLMNHVLPSARKRAARQEPPGLCLQLDSDTAFSDHPTFIAHSSIPDKTTLTPEPLTATCHRHTMRELQWTVPSLAEAVDNLHRRLIRPFADVLCFFSSGDHDLEYLVDAIVPWLEMGDVPEPSSVYRPRLLLVAASSERRTASSIEAHLSELLLSRVKQPEGDFLSYISVYVKNGSKQRLRDCIKREADLARNLRSQKHTLLNAVHFDLLFRHACDHFVNTKEPFDLLAASRLHRPVPAGLQTYLADLLTSVDTYGDITAFVAPFVATCLVLDNYAYDVPCECPCHITVCPADLASLSPRESVRNTLQSRLHGCSGKQNFEVWKPAHGHCATAARHVRSPNQGTVSQEEQAVLHYNEYAFGTARRISTLAVSDQDV